jgi:hypothetical protein
MLSGDLGSSLKMGTVLFQLGGSFATAAINLVSLPTHAWSYLAHYNPARAFGGGYGGGNAASALWRAASDLKSPKLGDAAGLEKIIKDGTYAQYGLTLEEAEFLFDATEKGVLQASQFNALVGTARGKVFNNKAQAAIQGWMSMFTYTEQFNRRVTALATYRLQKERMLGQGVQDQAQIRYESAEAARIAVNRSQGEYAMFNRPEMARGNVLQYIFMYKQFLIVTVQLLRGLPPAGQLKMLGMLFLMSGLKGLPFADDIADLLDTLMQMLGFKTASVEKAAIDMLEELAPGVSPYIMRGVLDRMTGATMSTRLGMGDLIPATGAFRAGADPLREVTDFAGPMVSALTGAAGTAAALTKYGAEAIGVRDDTSSLTEIMRNSPVATLRAVTDAMMYMKDGTITNNRGQVVSRDANAMSVITRAMGFYPAIATAQNDVVRLSKYTSEYALDIKASYVSAYVKAKLDNDTARMRDITEAVRDWNTSAKGTGLEISSFVSSANRAAREAERPTVARYLKSAPKQMRPETIQLLRAAGLEDEVR